MTQAIAVLISGGGSTLRNLIRWRDAGQLAGELRLVVSSNPASAGIGFAQAAGIETEVFDHRQYPGPTEISQAIFGALRKRSIGWAVCGGFLRKLEIPADFQERVVNIHPSLIPAHCGKGMYGLRVHRSVLAAGDRVSGCTVHLVDNEFDHGPVLGQRTVPVCPGDTAELLAARVFEAECQLYPAVINSLLGRELRSEEQKSGAPGGESSR